ncbi:MAG: alpha-ribazole phosphatase [Calditrichia bacterium]
MDVYLIRHTTPAVPRGTCYGHSDVELARSFPQELTSIKRRLEITRDFTIYSSPLSRCARLAQLLAKTGLQYDDRLMEMNFGDWEMQQWDDLDSKEFAAWSADFFNIPAPKGESYKDLYERSTEFLNELRDKKDSPVAIVTHSGVIRSMICYVLGMPKENLYNFDIIYAGICKLCYEDNRWRMVYCNL